MKKALLALTIATAFAACNGKPKETVVVIDTMAIKQKAILEEQARIKTEADEHKRAAAARRTAEYSSGSSSSGRSIGSSEAQSNTGSGTASEVPAKKGWSSAAKARRRRIPTAVHLSGKPISTVLPVRSPAG